MSQSSASSLTPADRARIAAAHTAALARPVAVYGPDAGLCAAYADALAAGRPVPAEAVARTGSVDVWPAPWRDADMTPQPDTAPAL